METTKLKPFDLEAAKRGEPMVTRDGEPAHFIAHIPEFDAPERVIVRVEGLGCSLSVGEDGFFMGMHRATSRDLFMAPRKQTLFVNVYSGHVGGKNTGAGYSAFAFDSNAEAERNAEQRLAGTTIGIAIPIEIEV